VRSANRPARRRIGPRRRGKTRTTGKDACPTASMRMRETGRTLDFGFGSRTRPASSTTAHEAIGAGGKVLVVSIDEADGARGRHLDADAGIA